MLESTKLGAKTGFDGQTITTSTEGHPMKRTITAIAVSLLTVGPVLASDQSDIMAVLNQWNDTDDAKAVAACADDASVIDDVPPFEWHGPGACSKWAKDYEAFLQKEAMTDVAGTIGKPRQLTITGNNAFAVVPSTFTYTKNGKPSKVTATATFSLHKTAAGWRITGWAWTPLTTG
jgi:ketosteroid isomerase-like protein